MEEVNKIIQFPNREEEAFFFELFYINLLWLD
jgi:hypothetical protein